MSGVPADAGLAAAMVAITEGDLAHVAATRAFVLDFLATHPDALDRSCADGHLTASALVLDAAHGRFVVLHHRKLGRWLQPGGHADGDADLAAVALREAQEETGLAGLAVRRPAIDLDVHEVRPPGELPHLHLDLRYLVEAPPGSAAAGPPPGNDESHEVRWVGLDDLDALGCDESLRRLATRALTRR